MRVRKLFFTLAPLALLAAAMLLPMVDPTARLGLAFDREGAVELARGVAAAAGKPVAGFDETVDVEEDEALERYLREHEATAPAGVAEVRRLAPPVAVEVRFRSAASDRDVEVWLTPGGGVRGLEIDAGEASPEVAAQEIARLSLEGWLEAPLLARMVAVAPDAEAGENGDEEDGEQGTGEQAADERGPIVVGVGKGEVTVREAPNRDSETFLFRAPVAGLADLTLEARVVIERQKVVERQLEARFARGFSTAAYTRSDGSVAPRVIVGTALFFLACTSMGWGLWRYWQRLREAEVSHARTLLLGLLVASLVGLTLLYLFLGGTDARINGEVPSGPLAFLLASLGVAAAVLPFGLVLGAVWSGCEGDVRQVFPEKLVSLDAILAGRFLSATPARSVLAGAACAAWVSLGAVLLDLPWAGNAVAGPDLAAWRLLSTHPFQVAVALGLAVLLPYGALGLLAPLSMLRQWTRAQGRTVPVLALILWSATMLLPMAWARLPYVTSLPAAALWAAAFLVPFFWFDVLAAYTSFLLGSFFATALLFLHQPALRMDGLTAFAGLAVGLGLVGLVARHGRTVKAVEVEPGYARNMHERMALSAELTAARQARSRMLPAQPPVVEGAAISVCCTAETASEGDYYDFFPLPDGRLAVVAAHFGRHGLAAALRLTLAKGFLLSYTRRGLPPAEVVSRLRLRLAELVADADEVFLGFGVFDPAARRFELALDSGGVLVFLGRRLAGTVAAVAAGGPGDAQTFNLEPGDGLAFLVFGQSLSPRLRTRLVKAARGTFWSGAEKLLLGLKKHGLPDGTAVVLYAGEERQ